MLPKASQSHLDYCLSSRWWHGMQQKVFLTRIRWSAFMTAFRWLRASGPSPLLPRWMGFAFLKDLQTHLNWIVGEHFAYRHWPEEGSVSFLILAHTRTRHLLRTIQVEGRSKRADCPNGHGFACSFVGVHGAHGELLSTSLAEASALAKRRPNKSNIAFIRDFYADMLPVHSKDPFKDRCERQSKDMQERQQVMGMLHAFGAQYHPDETTTGSPARDFYHLYNDGLSPPISRVPDGVQVATPSLLDCCASDGCLSSPKLDWLHFESDHAAHIAHTSCFLHQMSPLENTKWRIRCWQDASLDRREHAPDEFQDAHHISAFLGQLQTQCEDQTTRLQRRAHREPPAIKALRADEHTLHF